MKYISLSLLALVGVGLFSAASAAAANPAAAKNFVDEVATQVLAIVKNEDISQEEKQTKIESIFSDKVDINFVARFVLGKHWRTANAQEQKDYVAAYRPFILNNYAGKLTRYSGQTYTLKNARTEDDASVVTMEISNPDGQKVHIDYRLRGDDSAFRIIDIAVEGVSLLTTQRSEFNGIVERSGVNGLIGALNNQVAQRKG